MADAVAKSVPFVRFRVERALAAGDEASPEGRDRIIEQLRPVFATLPPSAMRLELTRLVSGRLELPESLAEQLLAGHRQAQAPPTAKGQRQRRRRRAGLSRREQTERAFLALCIACPDEGESGARGPRDRRALLQRADAQGRAAPAGGQPARSARRRRRPISPPSTRTRS